MDEYWNTGFFTDKNDTERQLPAKGKGTCQNNCVGVNDEIILRIKYYLMLPVQQIMQLQCSRLSDERWELNLLLSTQIHAWTTGDQNIHDAPHKRPPRRVRAAAVSIIPTTRCSKKLSVMYLPHLQGGSG